MLSPYPNAMANAVASSTVVTTPASVGNVNVISDVDAGPISVTLFVPLSLSSKNSIKPADVEPFLTDIPALNTSFCTSVETPVCVIVPVTVMLSLTVTSDVVCPIDTGTPDVAVPIVIPFDVFELSMFNSL